MEEVSSTEIDKIVVRYLQLHQEKHGVGTIHHVEVYGQVTAWSHYQDFSSELALRAVELVFTSKDLKWVKSGELAFLMNPKTWAKHIVPALNSVNRETIGGEQSEYGDRPDGAGYQRVW